jgi:hypothetical protein
LISDLSLLASLRVSLSREVASGDWPDATQGEDSITHSLAAVDVEVWNDAFIAKVLVAAGATVTIDLRSFTSLLFEASALDKVFAVVLKTVADAGEDAVIVVRPGATDGAQLFFEGADGIAVPNGYLELHVAPAAETAGWTLDATHKTIDLENVGADPGEAVIIIIGGS